jgi:hypothetical protein
LTITNNGSATDAGPFSRINMPPAVVYVDCYTSYQHWRPYSPIMIIKTSILSALFAASTYASPLLAERQSCPSSGITAARSTEVLSKFRSARVIPDSVPDFNPTIDLRVKYGNINENLGNTFSVLRKLSSTQQILHHLIPF